MNNALTAERAMPAGQEAGKEKAAPGRVFLSGRSWTRRWRRIHIVMTLVLVMLVTAVPRADAQNGLRVIRDVEIETLMHDMTNPILDAAGISRGAVNLLIVQDKSLNAFVAGGANLFLNTGLMMRTEHPGQLAGVIAP